MSLLDPSTHFFLRNSNLLSLKRLWKRVLSLCGSSLSTFARSILLVYRGLLSGHVGGGCRFEPSCSEYALECYQKHSFIRASQLTATRLSKCHPLSRSFGFDPVPTAKEIGYAKSAK